MNWYKEILRATGEDDDIALMIFGLGCIAFLIAGTILANGTPLFGVDHDNVANASFGVGLLLILCTVGAIIAVTVVDLIIMGACYFVTDHDHAPDNWLLHKLALPEDVEWWRDTPCIRTVLFGIASVVSLIGSILLALPPMVSIVLTITVGSSYAVLWLSRAVYRLNKKFVQHKNDPNAHTTKGEV